MDSELTKRIVIETFESNLIKTSFVNCKFLKKNLLEDFEEKPFTYQGITFLMNLNQRVLYIFKKFLSDRRGI